MEVDKHDSHNLSCVHPTLNLTFKNPHLRPPTEPKKELTVQERLKQFHEQYHEQAKAGLKDIDRPGYEDPQELAEFANDISKYLRNSEGYY
jgi:hypothetical protein